MSSSLFADDMTTAQSAKHAPETEASTVGSSPENAVMLTLEEQELDWHNGREKTNYAFWKCPMCTVASWKCLVCAIAS
ncbi:unnamed protein product [Sphagnum jensenii]|uniref:Uncharacterized protein n=1 Tax=Sphagnum jensenii TaxID=128206 RepID=A0ABP1AMX6_9BRYO